MTLVMERKAKYEATASPLPVSERWHNGDDMRWSARHWSARIGVRLHSVHLRAMTTKWASVSTAGRLTLNTELIALPRELGEFVIVHELVHLLCPDGGHGRIFKSFMSAYLPDWQERKNRLDAITKPL